jgi:hypothetical protein
MRGRRLLLVLLGIGVLAGAACGGGAPKASSADLLALHQPTPDPTLDAVVRDLPRALAGVAPTPTPTPKPTVAARQQPTPRPAVQKPAAPKATASPVRR